MCTCRYLYINKPNAVGKPSYWNYYNGVYLVPDKYLWNGLSLPQTRSRMRARALAFSHPLSLRVDGNEKNRRAGT